MESVSAHLSRHMYICGLLEVILQSSCGVPPCIKAEVAVLLLGCFPPTASSMSSDVLTSLLVALDTMLTDTANLATACIDGPSWMSCTTWATCVGCSLMLPLE